MDYQAAYSFIKRYPVISVSFLLGIGVICGGLFLLFSSEQPEKNDLSPYPPESPSLIRPTKVSEITIDIEGAVKLPGLYQMHTTARVDDVISRAGGFRDDADQVWIIKSLNRAARLSDGEKIYIPRLGETVVVNSSATDQSDSINHVVSINTASSSELDSLAGVGQTTALKIISNRPFSDINELVSKKIVNKRVFESIKDSISL